MNKLELLLHLNELGIKKIKFEFNGGGDEGSINERDYYDSLSDNTEPVDLRRINDDAKDFIEEMVDDIIKDIEDWWNNDGGGGVMTILVPEMTYEIQNYCYIQHQEDYSHEGELKFKED